MPILMPEERLGQRVSNRYMLETVLSVGGMGVLFAARDERTGTRVAVKMSKPAYEPEPERAARFARETRIAAGLRHANIAAVLDAGVDETGTRFLVMELLEGRSLAHELDDRRVLGVAEALAIVLPVAEALAAAHAMGVLHRDVKPSNIFLARVVSGQIVPKLLDFGIATSPGDDFVTETGTLVGSPGYMAPEQVQHNECGAFTDVWGLGAVLYRCLTGFAPHTPGTAPEILRRVAQEAVPPIVVQGASRVLCATIDRALARDPHLRYRSMQDFARALVEAARARDEDGATDTGSGCEALTKDAGPAGLEERSPLPRDREGESARRVRRGVSASRTRPVVWIATALAGTLAAAGTWNFYLTGARNTAPTKTAAESDPWACLDDAAAPSDQRLPVDVEFVAFDSFRTYTLGSAVGATAFSLVDYTPLPGTAIYGCYLRDVTCQWPATPRVVTDGAGVAHLTVAGGAVLYYRVDRADSFPGLYFPGRLLAGEPKVTYPVSTDSYLESIPLEILLGTKANTDPGKHLGHLIASVFDCRDRPLGGVSVELAGVKPEITFYLANRLPSTKATATDSIEGSAGFVNVPEGAVEVRSTMGSRQLTVNVYVRSASATFVDVRPRVRQEGEVSRRAPR